MLATHFLTTNTDDADGATIGRRNWRPAKADAMNDVSTLETYD